MRGRPGCLLQSARGEANRILLASALSSMRIICQNRVSRRNWIITVSLGCFVSLRTSSFRTNLYHLMPSSIHTHHWSSASIFRASVLDIAQQTEPYRNIVRCTPPLVYFQLPLHLTPVSNILCLMCPNHHNLPFFVTMLNFFLFIGVNLHIHRIMLIWVLFNLRTSWFTFISQVSLLYISLSSLQLVFPFSFHEKHFTGNIAKCFWNILGITCIMQAIIHFLY